MDAPRTMFPLPPLVGASPGAQLGPRSMQVPSVDSADPSFATTARVPAWLVAVAARLRASLGDFPDAVWLGTPAGELAAECDEHGQWTLVSETGADPARRGIDDARLAPVHEVPDSACDTTFADHPTAALWPMARRLCRIAIDGYGPAGPSVMMLVGSLPGRMSDPQHAALQDWTPAASPMLAMALEADARR